MYTKEAVKGELLENLYDLCYQAHSGTSFSPDRRAVSYVKDFSALLKEDLEKLGDNPGNYREKFINYFSAWMSAKGNCISSMIAGPSNFPVRRAQKANDREENAGKKFFAWREGYFKAVNRVPTPSPEDDLERAEKNVEFLSLLQLEWKEINAAIRKSKLVNQGEIVAYLLKEGYSAKAMESGLTLDYDGKVRVPRYKLTNNLASIKRYQDRVKILQTRIERKNTWEDIKFDGGYVTIEDDRVKVYHDSKPERPVIEELKRSGFRWSPNWGCWCRKHTGNAIYATKNLTFVKQAA